MESLINQCQSHHKSLSLTSSKLVALDHDFHVFGLVLFHIDVPDDYRDSFYTEKVHVIVKDKVLEASSPMRHATENASILREIKYVDGVNLENPVLFFFSDGGPNHRKKLSLCADSHISLFIALDLDLLVAERTAPCQSYRNQAEGIMIVLN